MGGQSREKKGAKKTNNTWNIKLDLQIRLRREKNKAAKKKREPIDGTCWEEGKKKRKGKGRQNHCNAPVVIIGVGESEGSLKMLKVTAVGKAKKQDSVKNTGRLLPPPKDLQSEKENRILKIEGEGDRTKFGKPGRGGEVMTEP